MSAHASVQKASLTPLPGGGHQLRVVSIQTDHENFCRALSDDEVAKYRKMFKQWDADGDGAITNAEFVAVMRTVHSRQGKAYNERKVQARKGDARTSMRPRPMHSRRACSHTAFHIVRSQAMFGLADLDKDGVVDFEEFVVMQA